MLKKFTYTKENGTESQRTVYVIESPRDSFLCIDLTEFDPEERDWYESNLQKLHNEYLDSVRDIGLATNWRTFLEKRISPPKKDE